MKVLSITQARFNSSRLPGKVLKEINGMSLLEIHFKRIQSSKLITDSILATTLNSSDDLIMKLSIENNWKCFRGSENNVLERFVSAVKTVDFIPDYIVRLTADCPLIDSQIIDEVINKAISEKLDYCSNTLDPMFPDGMDVEVINWHSLLLAFERAVLDSDKEHVTPYVWRNSTFKGGKMFLSDNLNARNNLSHVRLTVDEENDFTVIQKLITKLGINVSYLDYANYYLTNQEILSLNCTIKRNEGYQKSIENE